MGLRYLFHFCSAEGGQKDCTLEIFLPGYGKKRQKNRILQTNFESKRVDLPKEFDFSFFSQITFFMFCYVFWRFWQKKKNFVFFYKNFQNIVKFQIVRQFEKNDVLVENKNEISRQLQDGVSTLKMETLRFFLQSRKNFIIKKQLEISFFYANFLFIFLKKSRKNSEKNTQIGLAYTVWGPSILGYPICTYF